MHRYERVVRMADTDASGVMYFANTQMIALEAFEEFLQRYYQLDEMITKGDFLLPIVHVEADYMSSIKVGAHLAVDVSVIKIGTSSFTFKYNIFVNDIEVNAATIKITHVVMCKKSKKSKLIPHELLLILEKA